MAITISNFSVKLVTLPVNGKSVPIIAVYADFTGIVTDHSFIVTSDVYEAARAMWYSYPVGITLQRRGTALNALTDVTEINETNKYGVTLQGLFTNTTHEYYNIRYFVDNGGSKVRVFNTDNGYYLRDNNRQRISTGLLFVDTATGKVVPYSDVNGNNLCSETIPTSDENPNPNGASAYKGFPVCITPIKWVYATPHSTTITALSPYLVELEGITPYENADPYEPGGSSGGNGGNGTFGGGNTIFGGNSDSIDVPPLPTASASSAGFITLFNPSLAQLNNLANYMWSDLFSLDTFKKIFADPMDCILGLSIVPVKPASAGTSTVKIGNVSTDVSMNKTSSQYVAVDCGTIDVKEYWGAYLDYAPYTQCEIYLPYVGTKKISVDDVMNKAVHVVYHVDILSGACNAYVKCGDSVLYTFVGQCSSSIPISGNDWTNVLNGAISVAGKIGLAMATGGATALMSGLGAASSIISSSKPTVERSGAMSSTGGLLGIQKPYLILTRPKQALPENQNKYTGYPSFITMKLSDCTGYTEIDSVHLENMSCTDEETQEIENLLKSGVIF